MVVALSRSDCKRKAPRMSDVKDQVEYSKREHVARLVLQAMGTGYAFAADASLVDAGEKIFNPNPRAVQAVDFADRIIAVMQSKRRTWPREFLPNT